jgi:hypothetical protein
MRNAQIPVRAQQQQCTLSCTKSKATQTSPVRRYICIAITCSLMGTMKSMVDVCSTPHLPAKLLYANMQAFDWC